MNPQRKPGKRAFPDLSMTLAEAVSHLKVSREKLYRLVQQWKIPASKIGQQWRFNRTKVDALMEEHENTRRRGRTP